jgi:hypothetical protein
MVVYLSFCIMTYNYSVYKTNCLLEHTKHLENILKISHANDTKIKI